MQTQLAVILCSLLLTGLTAADYFYGKDFLEQSARFSRSFGDNPLGKGWFGLFGGFWAKAAAVGVVCALFGLKSKSDALLVFYAYCVTQSLGSAARLLYQDLRPCHFDPVLASRHCRCSFGKLSSGTCTVTAMCLIGGSLLSDGLRPAARTALRLGCLFLALNVGLGRVFLGHNGWNQVALGWLWGVWVFAGFRLLRATRTEVIHAFLQREESAERCKRQFNGAFLALFLGVNALCLGLWRRGSSWEAAGELLLTPCFGGCGKGLGLIEAELAALGTRNWGLPFALAWTAVDAPKTLFNSFFYLQSTKEARFAATRLAVFGAATLPLLCAALAGRFLSSVVGFGAATAAAVAFVAGFFFAVPQLLERFEVDLSGDFFTGGWPLRELGAAKPVREMRLSSAITI